MVTKQKTPAQKLAAIENAVPYLRAEIKRLDAIVTELEAIIGGGQTIGDKVREVTDHWKASWEGRYKEPFAWGDMATMTAQVKKLIKELGVDVVKSRISNYIANSNTYYCERRHPWPLFLRDINEQVHVVAGGETLSTAPDGCKHVPPCRDQFEHTKKRQTELTT